jgi:ABC-type multidrug transport system ATPase subunit
MYARLTVRIQLDTWARIAFVERSGRAEEVERIIRAFALEEIVDSRCDRISMGQRQRVRIAMTFIGRPELVLLDEPGTSLDEEGIAVLEAAIKDTVDRGGAVLWASPSGDRPGVEFTRRVMLEEGRLREL